MNLHKHLILPLAALWLGTGVARAEEAGEAATLSVQVPGFIYGSAESKSKADAEGAKEEKTTVSGLSTSSLGSAFAYITAGKWIFYLYPFNDASNELGAGYMVKDNLEVGLGYGLNSTSTKVGDLKTELSTNVLSPYLTFYTKLGPYDSEHILTLRLEQGSGKALKEGSDTDLIKTTASSTGLRYDLNLLQPLAKNFWLLHGLTINSESGEIKTGDEKTTESATAWSINLIGLRVTI